MKIIYVHYYRSGIKILESLENGEEKHMSKQESIFIDTLQIEPYIRQRLLAEVSVIEKALDVKREEISDITVLKKGMTNRSFLFSCRGKRYIMRIPGEGTDRLVNRAQEAAVYREINGKGICDNVVYIDPQNGYKLTEFFEGARVCNAMKSEDVKKCMDHLKAFHEMRLTVKHEFNIFEQIAFYESLWGGMPSMYPDYIKTRENVFSLKSYIESHVRETVLSHIDAVPDNFLFFQEESGEERIRLIDWEYAGMHDPHVDIAMFCIYSFYDKRQVDWLIAAYFSEGCDWEIRVKIYCYIAACGLLWSNWCEYKKKLGVEFGEYSLWQYRYARNYYKIAWDEMEKLRRKHNAHGRKSGYYGCWTWS